MSSTSTITTFNNFIDGRWIPSTSGETFENRNPANTDDLIGVFQKSTRRDVEAALEAARRAYVMESGSIALAGDAKTLLHDARIREAYLGEARSA